MSHSNYHKGQLCHNETSAFYLNTFDTHDDCNFEFNTPIHLKGKQYEIALTKMSIWLTMQNINTFLNNNNFTFFYNSSSYSVILPNGNYTINEINTKIINYFASEGLPTNLVIFDGNNSTGKITMTLLNGVSVEFSAPPITNLGQTLGYDSQFYTNTTGAPLTIEAQNEPKLNHYFSPESNTTIKIDSIFVNCDSVTGRMYANNTNNNRINRSSHSVIYKFSPVQLPNSLQIEEPYNLVFQHTKAIDELTTMRLFLTNQDNEPLGGMITKPILYSLMLKEY